MKIRLTICLLLIAAAMSSTTYAQQASTTVPGGQVDSQVVLDKLNNIEMLLSVQAAKVDSHDGSIASLAARVSANEAKLNDHAEKIAANRSMIESLTAVQESTAQTLSNIDSRLTATDNKFDALAERVAQLEVRQGQILRQSSDGNGYLLNLRGQMQNNEFRQEFSEAIDNSIASRTGTLVIQNKMASYQTIRVNGTTYGIHPGEVRALTVNPGTVATELAGEGVKTWLIGAPNYQQSIDIVPRQDTVTYYRAPTYVERVYVSRPVLTYPY